MSPKIFCALFVFSLVTITYAAPAKPKSPAKTVKAPPKISVDPKARAIFDRATALYHGTKNLRIVWRDSFEDADSSLEFSRVGLLRLNIPSSEELWVVDGKFIWHLGGFDDPKLYTRVPSHAGAYQAARWTLNFSGSDFTAKISDLLNGRQMLSQSDLDWSVKFLKLSKFRAVVLPAQKQNGQLCDVVRFNGVHPNLDNPREQVIYQQIYWFAHSDGRLLRFQERASVGNNKPLQSDCLIKVQDFKPTFAPNTFKFVPPKGAKLKTY